MRDIWKILYFFPSSNSLILHYFSCFILTFLCDSIVYLRYLYIQVENSRIATSFTVRRRNSRRFTIGSCSANCILVNKNVQKDIKYITAPTRTSLLSGSFRMSIRYARQRFYHMRDAKESTKYDYNSTRQINQGVYCNSGSYIVN